MYAIEFEAEIKDGVVRIPNEHKNLQHNSSAKFIVLVDSEQNKIKKRMSAVSIDTSKFKFNRDEANER